MKKLILLLTIGGSLIAQTPPFNYPINPQPLPIVTNIFANYAGARGVTTYYYWVVAKYAIGNANLSLPTTVLNTATTGSVALGWSAPSQPTTYNLTYDVLRTTTQQFPSSGSCVSCLVIGATSALTATDSLGALSNYSLSPAVLNPRQIAINDINSDRSRIYDNRNNGVSYSMETLSGPTLPTYCNNSDTFTLTSGTTGFYACVNGTWVLGGGTIGPSGPSGPNGAIGATGPSGPSGPGISGLTTNTIPKAASATTIANSSVTDNGTIVATVEPFQSSTLTTGISNITYYPAACGSLSTTPSWCSGSDMGAWINAAYAAGTSPVNISIDPGTYNVTTAISFATNGKIVTIQGNNAILNATSTLGTSGTLISSTIGGGANPTIAIYNLQLKDSISGSTATSVAIGSGGTNSDRARLLNVFMTGFKIFVNNTSYDLEITNSIFDNCSSASGSIGITISGNGDDTKITAGEVLGCATGVNNGNGNAVTLSDTVLGNATTIAVANNSNGIFTCNGCHYVNPQGTPAKFISNNGLYNDNAPHYEDDATTGTSGIPIANTGFFASNGGFASSSGATYTNFLATSGVSWNSAYNAFVQDRGGHLSDAYSRTTRGDRQISLENPDFENSNITPPPGWITIGTSVVVSYETSTQAPNKTQSIKFTAGGQFAGLEALTAYSVIPGDAYSLQCAAKSDATSTPTCVVQFQTNAGSFVGNMQVGTSSTSWVNLSTTGTVPATAVKAVIFLSNNTAAGAGTSWFDQVSIQKTNFPTLIGAGPVITSSAKPTITGCGTISSQTGGGLSGTFVTNATSCTAVLTVLPTTTAGYACLLWDQTHALTSSVVGNTSSTTTSATFGTVITSASDRLSFNCGLSN